jgi:hypothetical protein
MLVCALYSMTYSSCCCKKEDKIPGSGCGQFNQGPTGMREIGFLTYQNEQKRMFKCYLYRSFSSRHACIIKIFWQMYVKTNY